MGENEQGGMLRTVVVLGLIALIAAVVIGGVVYAKNNMQKTMMSTTALIDNATSIQESDVPVGAWQPYNSSMTVKAGQHVAVRSHVSGKEVVLFRGDRLDPMYDSDFVLTTDSQTSLFKTTPMVSVDGDKSFDVLDYHTRTPDDYIKESVDEDLTHDDLTEDQKEALKKVHTVYDFLIWELEDSKSSAGDATQLYDQVIDLVRSDTKAQRVLSDPNMSWNEWVSLPFYQDFEKLIASSGDGSIAYLGPSFAISLDSFVPNIMANSAYLTADHNYTLFAATSVTATNLDDALKEDALGYLNFVSSNDKDMELLQKSDVDLSSATAYHLEDPSYVFGAATDSVEVAIW